MEERGLLLNNAGPDISSGIAVVARKVATPIFPAQVETVYMEKLLVLSPQLRPIGDPSCAARHSARVKRGRILLRRARATRMVLEKGNGEKCYFRADKPLPREELVWSHHAKRLDLTKAQWSKADATTSCRN